jgi:hypothetical protein
MSTKFTQVNDVLEQLHKSGVVNLDKSVNEMLSNKDALGRLSPGGDVATAVIAWDGYGLVIASQVADQESLRSIAGQLRNITKPGQ